MSAPSGRMQFKEETAGEIDSDECGDDMGFGLFDDYNEVAQVPLQSLKAKLSVVPQKAVDNTSLLDSEQEEDDYGDMGFSMEDGGSASFPTTSSKKEIKKSMSNAQEFSAKKSVSAKPSVFSIKSSKPLKHAYFTSSSTKDKDKSSTMGKTF
jgi:hypothetical protein